MMWDARYRLLLNDDSTGWLEGWASILNRSGKSFQTCDVILVDGNLGRYRNLALGNRLDENQIASIIGDQPGFKVDGMHMRGGRNSETAITGEGVEITAQRHRTVNLDVASKSSRMTASGIQNGIEQVTEAIPERAPAASYTSERHGDLTLYALPFEATLRDSVQTEVVLLESSKVKAYQIYSFNGLDRRGPASVTLQLVNKEQEGLGLALPAAELQLFRSTEDGLEQFVGSHRLERTAAGDTVRVDLGGDPEIECACQVLERKGEKRVRELRFEHTMKNMKSDTVAVTCQVRFNGELTVKESSVQHNIRRRDTRTPQDDLQFTLVLPPDQEVKSTFAVQVKFPKQ